MKKRIFAGLMTFFMMFTLLSPIEVKAEETYEVSITLPEGAETIELTDETPIVLLDDVMISISGYEGEIIEVGAHFINENYMGFGMWFYPEEDGTLLSDYMFNSDWEEGTYELVEVSFCTEDEEWIYITENLPECSLTVINNVTDREEPVITGVRMESCGETFVQGQGESVSIIATIEDEGLGINEDEVWISIMGAHGEWVSKNMQKQADGEYATSIYIDGEEGLYDALCAVDYRVLEITAADMVGNSSWYYLQDYNVDLHFYVEDENGNCNTARDGIILCFYDEEYNLIEEFCVSSSNRVATLEELLDSVPEYESDLGFAGWRNEETGVVLQNDTKFLIPQSGYQMNLVPETQIKQVEVDMWCLNESGGMQWTGYETYEIPRGTTYAELLELLPAKETIDGCNFICWEMFDETIDLSAEVDQVYIDVCAVYDKMVVSIGKTYIIENGEYSYDFISLAVEEGITYEELLERIEAPDSFYPGCTFIGWEYSDSDILLDEEVVSGAWLSVSAEYDNYLATVLVAYVGDDNEVVLENKKELYAAGTLMQDICNDWIAKIEDEADGITEWYTIMMDEGEISIDNSHLVMIAQYADEVIVIYEPEYIEDAGEYGIVQIEDFVAIFDKDDFSEDNLISYFKDEIVPGISLYESEALVDWIYYCWDMNEDGYADYTGIYPEYEFDTPLIYLYDKEVMVYSVEAGQTISLPTEIGGYYVTWEDWEENVYTGSYTVPSDLVAGDEVYLYSVQGDAVEDEGDTPEDSKDSEDFENQTDSEASNQPADSNKPSDSSKPSVTAPDTSDASNSVLYMIVLTLGVAFILFAVNKRQNI